MEKDRVEELRKLYSSWDIEDIVRAVKFENNDYQPEAIDLMVEELRKRNLPEEEIAAAQATAKEKVEEEKKNIGGWLLLFIILLGFNSLIAIGAALSFQPIISVFYLGVAVYGVITLIFLSKKRNSAPTHAKIWIGITFVVNIISTIISISEFEVNPLVFILPLIFRNAILVLWYLYFSRSKRVAITYGIDSKSEENPQDQD